MVSTLRARPCCGAGSRGGSFRSCSRSCRHASSAWKPAPRTITGRVSCCARPQGEADAAALREALCGARQARCCRCRGDPSTGPGELCEAVARPTIRFVGAKWPDQQAIMMLHRVRKILTRQCTQISNALRAHGRVRHYRSYRTRRTGSADRGHRRSG
jgi:hypothetical protein